VTEARRSRDASFDPDRHHLEQKELASRVMASLEEARKTVVSAANKRRCKKSIVQPVHAISEGKFWVRALHLARRWRDLIHVTRKSSTLSEETASQLSDLVVNLKALYTILPEPGLSFAAALFRKIHEEKLVPLAKKSQSIGVKNVLSRWEELSKAIVSGVLVSREYKQPCR
jgi:hypothetical protein